MLNLQKQIQTLEAEYAHLDKQQTSKKLALNSTYGLLANQYNFMYCPEQQINVCLTGQLFLLMCGEIVSRNGGGVTSYNTDGLNFYCDKSELDNIQNELFGLELDSGQVLEYTPYAATYNESVNSYIALKPDGTAKGKGFYAKGWLGKNPDADICVTAVIDYLNKGVPIEQTISECKDIKEFLTARNVTGGAVYDGVELGKVVRFYHSSVSGYIAYKKNGNKVAKSDNCKPLMNLCEGLPSDLNLHWYVKECYSNLKKLGL